MSNGGRGYLVLADITGYTRFLTGSELDHAEGILRDPFGALTEQLQSPVVLSKTSRATRSSPTHRPRGHPTAA